MRILAIKPSVENVKVDKLKGYRPVFSGYERYAYFVLYEDAIKYLVQVWKFK